jgi:PAS domain S-box-containing protein
VGTVAGARDAADSVAALAATVSERPLRILILEDRAMDADLVVRHLRRDGFEIEAALATDEASYLAALDPAPDVILADYSLPRFDALSALRHLRARGLDIPFIVVTGTITEETAVAALREGAADYLLKDRLGRLPEAVRRALADRESRQRQRQAEQALRESEARYRSVSELTSDFAYAAEVGGDGTLTFEWITDAITAITGYTASELRSFDDLAAHAHPDDRPALRDHLARVLAGHRDSRDCRITTRLGDERLLRLHTRPERDPQTGRVTRVYGAAQDLTEQRRSERAVQEANVRLSAALDELQQTQQQMVQQERLRALGEMASGIAHDFNNSLTMILGFSELMLAEPELLEDAAQVRQNLELVTMAAQDAASIVRRLRELYRERTTDDDVDAVDLKSVARAAIALTEPRWRAQAQAQGVHLTVTEEVQPGSIALASEADLRELLTNLIINAVDACEDQGTIVVRAAPDGDAVLLEVSDDGHGMTDEVRARCLEPFFTTKEDRGTGLGLPMVYAIVQRHGGSIAIDSAPGRGTTIGVRLPRALVESTWSTVDGADRSHGPWHVLIVDDEEHVRTVLRRYLSHAGHDVASAASAPDALAIVEARAPDLVLLDRAMPEMSGDRLASLIRDRAPATRIVMLSGFGVTPAADETIPVVDGMIAKPVRLNELLSAIGRVMEAGAGGADENDGEHADTTTENETTI